MSDSEYPFHDTEYIEEEYDDTGQASVQLTPGAYEEIQAELKRKRRNKSIMVAVGIHVLILVVAAIIIVSPGRRDEPEIVAEIIDAPPPVDQQMQRLSAVKQVEQTQASASSSVTKMMRANISSVIAAPEADIITDSPVGFGDGDFGDGFGSGSGGGGMGGLASIPVAMRSRCDPGERMRLLIENGGTPAVEDAVVKTLDWLQTQQNQDGSWGRAHKGAMTGLALLVYLGHCETPDSPKYGGTVLNGIMYLVELSQKNGGRLATMMDKHWPYEHGIAAYALGETYAIAKHGTTKLPGVRDAFEEACQIIISGQCPDGGWYYGYESKANSDLSVSGWQFQALKAAVHTGLKIGGLASAQREAAGFFDNRQLKDGGFGYHNNKSSKWTLTGAGVLGLQFTSRGKRSQITRGLNHIFKDGDPKYNGMGGDAYAFYYFTQACFQARGEYWERWNKLFRDDTIAAQNADGSFRSPTKGPRAGADNLVYLTCLNALQLEVYYRYLATGK